ncbi:LexA family protein [Allisonella histaminiformans]|uniref:LexA family protein n=1 Tax=Allisonella histaminiformans TaxID=209880 RepID=UPI002E75E138|nr:S24 family peptidase [Allisonella histaminiformans]
MFIGNNIKRARELKGLTQDELAKRMGYKSRSTIARIENGDNDVSQSKLKKFAEILDVSIDFLLDDGNKKMQIPHSRGIRIPILGRVVAGIPLEAITDIEGYEEITPKMASLGEYFALRIKGHSMEPQILDNDVVICKCQSDVEFGDIAIILVNGDEATCKQVKKSPEGVTLIGFNPVVYPPHFYSNKEIETLPVNVIGKVVELRRSL